MVLMRQPPPQAIRQNWGGGSLWGGRLGGVGGGGSNFSRGGGVPKVGGRAHHMHAPCLANLALKSTDGLMKRKHTLNKGGAVGAMPPTHYLSKPRGGGGAGGVAYKDWARPPPPPPAYASPTCYTAVFWIVEFWLEALAIRFPHHVLTACTPYPMFPPSVVHFSCCDIFSVFE